MWICQRRGASVGPETTEAREGRACKQQYSSRACSATSGAKSDGGFPFPSALHITHDGGAIRHCGRTNRCYWLNPARIDRNGTSGTLSGAWHLQQTHNLSQFRSNSRPCSRKPNRAFIQCIYVSEH
ncbi:uncharacterized protein LOC128159244 [Crassostrea angulata]|uniref:uncharacterized protein LOC128159244 n=1 Tax=Magallana angulata TaxID=2784310 RepID=UPI0022B1EFD3|nr:uncharacterized protein LOC128159244 [Crassostrea angulata]